MLLSAVDMVAVFTVAALAGTGVGGGGLLVIYLTMLAGYPQLNAQALNLVFFIAASISALPYHICVGHRQINFRAVAVCAVFGTVGAFLGGRLRESLDPSSVRAVFGSMLIVTGISVLFHKKKDTPKTKQFGVSLDSRFPR